MLVFSHNYYSTYFPKSELFNTATIHKILFVFYVQFTYLNPIPCTTVNNRGKSKTTINLIQRRLFLFIQWDQIDRSREKICPTRSLKKYPVFHPSAFPSVADLLNYPRRSHSDRPTVHFDSSIRIFKISHPGLSGFVTCPECLMTGRATDNHRLPVLVPGLLTEAR